MADALGLPMAQRQVQIMGLLRSSPQGISSADIAKAAGLSRSQTKATLTVLRSRKLALPIAGSGQAVLWTAAEHQPRLVAVLARKQRAKREAEDSKGMRPVQRVVKAGRMPPPVCTAVNSVFALVSL